MLSAANPPATGPITGPSNGPIANNAIAAPLFSCGMTSAIVPPPIVSGAEPPQPAMNRNAKNIPMSVLTAQAMQKIMKIALHVW